MSSKAEMSSGLTNGILQGFKSGLGFSRMESGFKKGLLNGIRKHDKVQDPTAGLIASKRPKLFWLADYTYTSSGVYPPVSGNTIGGTDGPFELMDGGLMVANSGPIFRKGVFNEKGYVDFASSADRVSSPTMIAGKSELTLFMVMRLSSILTGTVFHRFSGGSIGDIQITSVLGTKIRVSFIGSPTSTSSVYETYDPTIAATENTSNGTNINKWFMLTVKFDLTQRNGNGSEMEIYINGVKNMTPVTTTFARTTTTTMPTATLHYGNTSTSSNDINFKCQIASSVVFDYWLSNAEQMRIENFYRYYYGYRF